MSPKVLLFLILSTFSVLSSSEPAKAKEKVVVCYVGTWSVYRPKRGSFSLGDINPKLCTNLIYSFAGLNSETFTIKPLDDWQDLPSGKDGFNTATRIKEKYPHLKVSLAIGGWNEGSINYSALAADPARRKTFIKSVLDIIRKFKFDGLDLDWEYPSQRGGSPNDKKNFVSLAKELREAFNRKYLLTSAIGINPAVIEEAYDIENLNRYLDFFHLMCYDYHGTWDRIIGANAPLRNQDLSDKLTVEQTVNIILSKGAPPDKVVLGVPFYGRTFVLKDTNSVNVVGAAAEPEAFGGNFTNEKGFMGYNEICLELDSNTGWVSHWDDNSQTPYAVNDKKVIMYDNQKSIAAKVRFAMSKQLAGIMIWSIDTDDFHADCTNNEPDKFDNFVVDAKSIENSPFYKDTDLSKISHSKDSSYFIIRDSKVILVKKERPNNSFPLLSMIKESLDLCSQLSAFNEELNKTENSNEVIPTSGSHCSSYFVGLLGLSVIVLSFRL